MNGSDESPLDHHLAWELIPWLVNGRASADDRTRVERHLAVCADCRIEYAFEQQLYGALQQRSEPPVDAAAVFQQFWQRVDESQAAAAAASSADAASRRSLAALAAVLAVAVAIEAIALGFQSAVLWQRSPPPAYRTLIAVETAARPASIRLVLAPQATVGQFEALLADAGLQIVNGPTAGRIYYSLAPVAAGDASAQTRALTRLRAAPFVRLAEPITASAAAP